MTQQIRMIARKPDNLSWIQRYQVEKEKTN